MDVRPDVSTVNRRDLLELSTCGVVGLPLDGLLDVTAVRSAAHELKLSDVQEFTTSCNFCSCGCGMVAAGRDGKLITLEGDFETLFLADWTSLHLDVIASDRGLKRLAASLYELEPSLPS